MCCGEADCSSVRKNNLMWAVPPQSVQVLFVLLPSCCSCIEGLKWTLWCYAQPEATFSCCDVDTLMLEMNSDSVLFGLCLPDPFPQKLSAILSHLYCFCCFSFNPTCHFFLICMYLLPRMCFIWNASCTVGFHCFSPPGLMEMFKRSSCCRIYKCIFY